MNDIQTNHLDGEQGVTNKVKQAMFDVRNSFIYIGFLLDEADRLKYYLENGYQNIFEYCEDNFGFKRSSTQNFIKVYRCFGDKMNLFPAYKDFNYSQLVEMSSADPIIKFTPDMSVSQIRELKKNFNLARYLASIKNLMKKLYKLHIVMI